MTDLWRCPSAESWDRYLLDADSGDREQLGEHLENCAYCRLLVENRKRELAELAYAWTDSRPAAVIYLTPYQDSAIPNGHSATLLAAKGNGESKVPGAIALASPDEKVLLRAVRDAHTREVWLYLLSEEPDLVKNVVVKPFGQEQEFVTDAEGRVNLGDIEWPSSENLNAELRLPMATFHLEPIEPSDQAASLELRSEAGDRIRVSLTGTGRNRVVDIRIVELAKATSDSPVRVAMRGQGSLSRLQVEPVELDHAAFKLPESQGEIEIYIYQ